jgi:hypothetical protein
MAAVGVQHVLVGIRLNINLLKIHIYLCAGFLNIIFDMQKTDIFPNRRTVSQTGKIIPAVSKPTGLRYGSHRRLNGVLQTGTVIPAQVNRANSKVNKTIIQSACGFHLRRQMASCVLSTSKRFQCLKTACPSCFMQRGKRAPKSCVFNKRITKIQQT